MRVLVCGGRDFSDPGFLNNTLDALHQKHGFTLLIEGDARGADRLASEWAGAHGIEHVKYHADWENLGQRRGRSGTRRCFRKGNPTWWWRSLAAAGRLT